MNTIRLLLADDHENVRKHLVARLSREPGIVIVGQAETSYQLMEYAFSEKPNVILVDPQMQDGLGLAAMKKVAKHLPDTVMIVLTAFLDTLLQMELKKIGVNRQLTKGIESARLVDELLSVNNTNGTNLSFQDATGA